MHKNQITLDGLTTAWLNRDVEGIVSFFATDGVFFASSGYGDRQEASGHDEIRALTTLMFETDDGAVLEPIDKVIFDEGAFCRWRYILPCGEVSLGCDYFRMENALITLKDAYRKIGSFHGTS
jgi:hypothetical protein